MLVVQSCIHLFRFIISYSCIKNEFVFINPHLKKGLYKSSYHTGHQSVCQMTYYMMKGFLDRPHYVLISCKCVCVSETESDSESTMYYVIGAILYRTLGVILPAPK